MNRLLAQVLVCTGGACLPLAGGPPVERLKAAWKERRLYGRMHLTFTGCLGRCDRPAQVLISHDVGSLVLAGIAEAQRWDALIDWAAACTTAERVLALPDTLLLNLDQPWRRP